MRTTGIRRPDTSLVRPGNYTLHYEKLLNYLLVQDAAGTPRPHVHIHHDKIDLNIPFHIVF